MEHLKIKVIGVLRERDGEIVKCEKKTENMVRQLPKMSALDLAGILNCRRRMEWTKEWLKKNQTEFFSKENILKEIQSRGNETYHLNCFFDITERQFRFLVNKLAPTICSYEPHRKKKTFSAEERIAITLKYLATGEVHSCRNYCFRASKPVILNMISNICLNMYEILKDQFISLPKTEEQWQNVANDMQRKHKLPNCIGVLSMQQMQFYATARHEDQPDYSIKSPLIFSAIVDCNNNFMHVDIEKTKATMHEEIYEYSRIKESIESRMLSLPRAMYLAGGNKQRQQSDVGDISYYFAGCNALPVKPYLLNSFYAMPIETDQNSNINCKVNITSPEYAYCSAIHVANVHAENALRMLSNIFPILSQSLRVDEASAKKILLGCVALYNFLRRTNSTFFKKTERMNLTANELTNSDYYEYIHDDGDDDCILIGSEEEMREREEFRPNVALTSCFQCLRKQKGNTAAGLAKRNNLMCYFAKVNSN